MIALLKIRPCEDPLFQYVLIDSRLLPGTKAWKLMRVDPKPEIKAQKGVA